MWGLVYRSKADINLKSDTRFSRLSIPNPWVDSTKISRDNPQLLKVGLRYNISDDWTW